MASMFKRGFKAVTEEKKRQDENRAKTGGMWRFFLSKDGDEGEIVFLTEQPINYYEHNLKTFANGKERFDQIPCIGEGCKHCERGDRPTFKSAWLVVDTRENRYTDANGKEQVSSNNVRLFIYGTKIASQLDRIASKYGILHRSINMVRMGKGTSTSYMFERGDEVELTPQDIEELLPENVREQYDGTEDSLYTILENQIMMMADTKPSGFDATDDEDEKPSSSNLVSLEDDDEEEEIVQPKKKLGNKKFSTKHENSVKTKTSVKRLLKRA